MIHFSRSAGIGVLAISIVLPIYLMIVYGWWWYFLYAVEFYLITFHTDIVLGDEKYVPVLPEKEDPEQAGEPGRTITARESDAA